MGVRVCDHWESLCEVPNRACARGWDSCVLEAGGVLSAAALGSLGDLKAQLVKKKTMYCTPYSIRGV